MADVENRELVQKYLGRWDPSDLAFVEAFAYTSSSNGKKSRLGMVALFQQRDRAPNGWPSENNPTIRVTIEFEGVSNFQIKAVGPYPKQVMGFNIRDASEDCWEGIRFVVQDYESGQLSFNCEKISLISSEQA